MKKYSVALLAVLCFLNAIVRCRAENGDVCVQIEQDGTKNNITKSGEWTWLPGDDMILPPKKKYKIGDPIMLQRVGGKACGCSYVSHPVGIFRSICLLAMCKPNAICVTDSWNYFPI